MASIRQGGIRGEGKVSSPGRRLLVALFTSLTFSALFAFSPAAEETIRIASWNIQNFRASKAKDPDKMRAIAAILKEYDLIAVQEISKVKEQSDPGCPRNENACPGDRNCGIIGGALEEYLNQENGLHYRFVFCPQVRDER